jgi:hypothetical protein
MRDLLQRISSRKIFVNLGDASTIVLECDTVRAVSENLIESPVRNLALKCLVDAESRSAGASFVALSVISGLNDNKDKSGRRFTFKEIERNLRHVSGKLAADIVVDAIKIAGRQGKIFLDSSDVLSSEITHGTQLCKWKPDQKFFEVLRQQKVSAQSCRVIFIDGIIESVSECHRIFNDSYETKTPVVIFARGYADDVISTAAINIQRQTAYVVPVLIPFDEVGVNGMADLASCFGSDVISADKGQLISSASILDCKMSARISCNLSGTEIEFIDDYVDNVVGRLSNRLHDCEPHQADLIRRRIDALGTGAVTIKLGSDKKSLSGIQRDRVDFSIRYVRSCMQSGVAEFNGVILPYRSVKVGIECAESFLKVLQQNGAILEVDRCG